MLKGELLINFTFTKDYVGLRSEDATKLKTSAVQEVSLNGYFVSLFEIKIEHLKDTILQKLSWSALTTTKSRAKDLQ